MVHFVGAGPGASDLITVRGDRLLREADVVIYAGSLVNPELLKGCRTDCAVYDSAYMTLEEVLEVIRDAERRGEMTVRLHTGDPSIYGAIREQMDALDRMGIAYDVCPGVSSFLRCCCRIESGVHFAGSIPVSHYNPYGGQNKGSGKKNRSKALPPTRRRWYCF